MTAKPTLMPRIWGTVLRMPKLTPDASTIMLFGPGVMDVTTV